MRTPTTPSTRILIADDHPIFREGLAALISTESGMELVGQAADGREAIALYRKLRPDIVLIDLQMPEMGGIEAISAIRAEFPDARLVVLTTYKGDAQAMRAFKAGAAGYLLKSTLRAEMVDTITSVMAGRRKIPAEIAQEIAQHAADDLLSPREIQVISLAAVGLSNKSIARKLDVSEETVKTHMKGVLSKLDAKDRTHAVTIAIKRGIIEL